MTKRLRRATRETTLAIPDIHTPHQDDEAIATVLNLAEDIQPDVIDFLGDISDFYVLSKFDKNPRRILTLQDELDKANEILWAFRHRCLEALMRAKLGNHGDRLRKWLWAHPEMCSLKCLELEELWGLDEIGIRLYGVNDRYEKYENFIVTHGKAVRKNAGATAHAELTKRGVSGISAHTHRAGYVSKTNEHGTFSWVESGCLCRLDPEYVGDEIPDWQHAVTLVHRIQHGEREIVTHELLVMQDKCIYRDGRLYTPEGIWTP